MHMQGGDYRWGIKLILIFISLVIGYSITKRKDVGGRTKRCGGYIKSQRCGKSRNGLVEVAMVVVVMVVNSTSVFR